MPRRAKKSNTYASVLYCDTYITHMHKRIHSFTQSHNMEYTDRQLTLTIDLQLQYDRDFHYNREWWQNQ